MKKLLVHKTHPLPSPPLLIGTFVGLLFLTAVAPSKAAINRRDGGFIETTSDFGITRTYKSRSLLNGVFGFGWCSNLDIRIKILSAKHIEVRKCGKLQPQAKMQRQGQHFIYKDSEGLQFRFRSTGQLDSVRSPNHSLLNFKYSRDGQYLEGLGLLGKNIQYKYNKGRLVSAQLDSEKATTYKYDSFNNLIQVVRANGSQVLLTYDLVHDRLIGMKTEDGCSEKFSYSPRGPNHYFILNNKLCEGRPVQNLRYDFWFGHTMDLEMYLSRTRVSTGQDIIETIYDPNLGRPQRVSLSGGNLGVSVAFNRSGQISEISSDQPGRELEAAARLLELIDL